MALKLSVIIPTLNEAEHLEGAVEAVGDRAEVIVCDGGSSDRTCKIARRLGALLLKGPQGRGAQMDLGAEAATGDVLLFLHADTRLPAGWHDDVREALEDHKVVAGGFRLAIDAPGPWFRLVERVVELRFRLLGLLFGDQAIFVRKDVFHRVGGFERLPLMEDVDCVKRLKKAGKVVLLEKSVITSSRRWLSDGLYANTMKNGLFLALYHAGIPPRVLYRWYYRTDPGV